LVNDLLELGLVLKWCDDFSLLDDTVPDRCDLDLLISVRVHRNIVEFVAATTRHFEALLAKLTDRKPVVAVKLESVIRLPQCLNAHTELLSCVDAQVAARNVDPDQSVVLFQLRKIFLKLRKRIIADFSDFTPARLYHTFEVLSVRLYFQPKICFEMPQGYPALTLGQRAHINRFHIKTLFSILTVQCKQLVNARKLLYHMSWVVRARNDQVTLIYVFPDRFFQVRNDRTDVKAARFALFE
jgi:hypothetical protein